MSEDPPIKGLEPLLNLLGRSLEEGETTRYSRSDVLRPLVYPIAVTIAALPFLVYAQAPTFVLDLDGGAAALLAALYVGIYVYCFLKRPDSLRSERYELAKYAIQQHLFGDNRTGLIESAPVRVVSATSVSEQLAEVAGTVK